MEKGLKSGDKVICTINTYSELKIGDEYTISTIIEGNRTHTTLVTIKEFPDETFNIIRFKFKTDRKSRIENLNL